MTRREHIWEVAYATAMARRIDRLIDLGMSRDVDGTERPFLNDEALQVAYEASVKTANLTADMALGEKRG